MRRRWLDVTVRVRTATKPASMRLAWPGGTIVPVGFASKGVARSQVAIEHPRLASANDAARVKDEWAVRFDALARVLSP